MRQITRIIYSFDELKENIQSKLFEETQEKELEFYIDNYLETDMTETGEQLLNEIFPFATFNGIYYNLGYYGKVVVGFNIELDYLNDKYHMLTNNQVKKLSEIESTINVKINNYTFEVCYQDYTYYLNNERGFNIEKTQSKLDNIIEVFKTDINNMNKKLLEYSSTLIDAGNWTKSDILDILHDNEYYSNGEIYEEELQ